MTAQSQISQFGTASDLEGSGSESHPKHKKPTLPRRVLKSIGLWIKRETQDTYRTHSLHTFEPLVDEKLITPKLAKKMRWSAHRAEYRAIYASIFILIGTAPVAGLTRSPRDTERMSSPALFFAFSLLLVIIIHVAKMWGSRYARDRIQLQVKQLLESIREVNAVASGDAKPCRFGNPSRWAHLGVRDFRSKLRRAATTIPGQFIGIDGRGHQNGDTIVRDKLKVALLHGLTNAPIVGNQKARDDLKKLLIGISTSMMTPNPATNLEPSLRHYPTRCGYSSEPLKTWSWRWYKLSPPVIISIIALPVLAFLVSRTINMPTSAGFLLAGAATGGQAIVKYLEYRRER